MSIPVICDRCRAAGTAGEGDFSHLGDLLEFTPVPRKTKRIDGWRSASLGMEMPIVTYGHAGHPLLLFPTAAADFLENERFWLVKSGCPTGSSWK